MSIYKELVRISEEGERAAICTVIFTHGSTPRHAGSKMIVYPNGKVSGTIGGGEMENRVVSAAIDVIENNEPQRLEYTLADPSNGDPGLCGGQMEVFVEPVQPSPTIVVIGAGHVGKAVVHLADWLDYHVVLSDDRAEFCNPESAPGADEYHSCHIGELPERIKIHSQTYLVLTTRNSSLDIEGLPILFESQAKYFGVIGSKRRWEITRKSLKKLGIAKEKLDSVFSPMGIEINAESPEEIALSILSQIINVQSNGANN